MSDLSHRSKKVLERLRALPRGTQVPVHRKGRLEAYLVAADPSEQLLDDRAAAGEVRPDWREQQSAMLAALREQPPVDLGEPDARLGSSSVLADREDTDR